MSGHGKLEEAYLLNIYTELQRKGVPFEVVFVPAWDPISCPDRDASRKCYEELVSSMPWPAIPFSDSECYEHLGKIYGTSICGNFVRFPASVFISPAGEVVQNNASTFFSWYGAAGFPFTDERIRFLYSKDVEAEEHPSLTALLASSDRNYVINNKGDKVFTILVASYCVNMKTL